MIGSVVVSNCQLTKPSSSASVVKYGTVARLYLGHVAMQLDHSDSKLLNFTLDIGDLNIFFENALADEGTTRGEFLYNINLLQISIS